MTADLSYFDRTRSAFDIAHDEVRFAKLGLTRENLLAKMAEAGTEIAGWGAGNEAAVMRFAMNEIATLRAKLDGYEAEGEVNKNPKAQEG